MQTIKEKKPVLVADLHPTQTTFFLNTQAENQLQFNHTRAQNYIL